MAQAARFPVLDIARRSYLSLFHDLPALARAAGLWVALMILLEALAGFAGFDPQAMMEGDTDAGDMASFVLLALLGGVVHLLGITAVAVFWHRRILLGEPAPAAMAPVNWRVGAYLWAFFKIGAALFVLALGAMLSVMLAAVGFLAVAGESPLAALLVAAIQIAAMVAIFVLLLRLQLVLPAAAVHDPAMTMRASWRATSGSGLRLLLAAMLVSLPLLLVVLLGALAALLLAGLGLLAMAGAANVVLGFLQVALLTGLLSHSYRFFKDRAAAPAA